MMLSSFPWLRVYPSALSNPGGDGSGTVVHALSEPLSDEPGFVFERV